jgi:hypothetical protein
MNPSIDQILNALQRSAFRSGFHLSDKDINDIDIKGTETIKTHAFDFISSRIAPQKPKNDGKQTPMKNHPIFIAQHATATCCRKCLQKWHGIQKGKQLSPHEITYIVEVLLGWIERQQNR